MMTLAANLAGPDWIVLGAYFALLAVTGWWFARRRAGDAKGYFVGDGAMPAWAVGISILATSQSAATFIGVPQESFRGDLTYLMMSVGALLAAGVIARWFIPAYYRRGVWTAYELLEARFGSGARLATSVTYLVGRVFATGSRVFIGSLPASMILFGDTDAGHVVLAVGVMTFLGIVYTLAGGIRSVIWTDVIQTAVYLGTAVLAAVVLWRAIGQPWGDVQAALASPPGGGASKLRLIDLGLRADAGMPVIDWTRVYTLITAATGLMLLNLAAFGTDQDFVQRTLACKDAGRGGRSVLVGTLANLPATGLFLVIGLLLWVYYHGPGSAGHAPPGEKSVFLGFIMREMPVGLKGLMLAGLLAAGLSTVNSTLNSMASSFVADVYGRGGFEHRRTASAGRWSVAGAGVLVGGFAAMCVAWYDPAHDTLVTFALSVMTFAYAGLLGVFLTALFTTRGSGASAVAALGAGFASIALTQPGVLAWMGMELKLAFPWQLVIGAGVAFAVCACVPGRHVTRHEARHEARGKGKGA
ncbi:MAG: hypothetical protein HBSAPP03_04140 [Phycisphaerae bacterium]|nr:MAG: hypothetical protein HBSAPP03_04140 [Phycisphaerae bacterium]